MLHQITLTTERGEYYIDIAVHIICLVGALRTRSTGARHLRKVGSSLARFGGLLTMNSATPC